MRRTEALLLCTLLIAVVAHQSFLAMEPLGDGLPEHQRSTDDRDSGPETSPQGDPEDTDDPHIFWMRDGWYYKKFDRYGNELTKEDQNSNQSVTGFISEEEVDIDSNQDIHFVWVPGGHSGEVHYVKYDTDGNVIISEHDNTDPGEEAPEETHSRCIIDIEILKEWWFV